MILCDMDGVLATGSGRDTAPGEPIYRTFTEPPGELELIRAAGIPFHIVTAKVEAEAVQVLEAIGLDPHIESIVGANQLFWPSVWGAVTRGRFPRTLVKSAYRTVLPAQQGQRIVMLEDRRDNLREMLAADAIDCGILVPSIRIARGHLVEWFDVNLALGLARQLAVGGMDPAGLSTLDVSIRRWYDGDFQELDSREMSGIREGERYLLRVPGLSFRSLASRGPSLESLDTGRILMPGRRDLVTSVRLGRRLIRRTIRNFLGSSVGGK